MRRIEHARRHGPVDLRHVAQRVAVATAASALDAGSRVDDGVETWENEGAQRARIYREA